MPPRDSNEYQGRRRQIIDGALEVFAVKGYEKATNKEIARAAGIGSPGLIYHYFKDKADLFRQVVEQRAPVLQVLARGEELMELPPREVLTLLATSFADTMDNRTAITLFKLMLGESIRRPMVAEMVNRIGPGRGLGFLTRYLQLQMDQGVLRRMDPGAAARCLVGPLIAYIMT